MMDKAWYIAMRGPESENALLDVNDFSLQVVLGHTIKSRLDGHT